MCDDPKDVLAGSSRVCFGRLGRFFVVFVLAFNKVIVVFEVYHKRDCDAVFFQSRRKLVSLCCLEPAPPNSRRIRGIVLRLRKE